MYSYVRRIYQVYNSISYQVQSIYHTSYEVTLVPGLLLVLRRLRTTILGLLRPVLPVTGFITSLTVHRPPRAHVHLSLFLLFFAIFFFSGEIRQGATAGLHLAASGR